VRSAFVESLVDLARDDERIVLLTGDLGFTVLEPFADRFPDRFFNLGVAEQNMVGVATGLAEAGFTPYVYSIATFASMRAYEFIRNGPVQHNLPVRIVGVGGGFDYGPNGLSHYALEDVALMRTQPGMCVVAPAEPEQVRSAMPIVQAFDGPVYLRLGKGSAAVPGLRGRFELGRAHRVRDGHDVEIVALGGIAADVVAAAEELESSAISAGVIVVASVSPPPAEDIAAALGRVPLAVAAEGHYVNGGLGSLVAEAIAEHGLDCRLVRAGVKSTPAGTSGSRDYMHGRAGISELELVRLVGDALSRMPSQSRGPAVPLP
jgi:transketolase